MLFKYSAKTRDGLKTRKGEIDSPNQRQAVNLLREKGLIVYSLVPQAKNNDILSSIKLFNGVSINEKVKFTEQLASMMVAGLPMTKALELQAGQADNKKMGEIISNVLSEVEAGTPLSTSLERQGDIFSRSYISLVRAGEASGKLDKVLEKLAISLEKQREFKSKVKGALLYPTIITTAMIGVFFIIVVFVIPKMTAVYASFDVDLPITTRALIKLSNFLISYWWMALALIAGVFFGLRYLRKTTTGDYYFSVIALRLPVFGKLLKQSAIVEFTQTLGLLVESGVPIIEGLEIVRDSLSNALYREAVTDFIEDVKHGYPLSQSVARDTIFPPLVSQMLVVGEETGTVDTQMNNLANFYTGEVDKVVKNLSVALEPIIMIMLGVMVGVLIFSVITPIYQLTSKF